MPDRPHTTALEELRDDPSSRKQFLRRIGGGAAAATLAVALAACGSKKPAGNQFGGAGVGTASYGQGDAGIVNYALALEYLESDFYDKVVEAGVFSGATGDLFKEIQENEHEHVDALTALAKKLGGSPPERPVTRFPLGKGAGTALRVAATLENVGAAAYLGQISVIENREVLAAALSIHSVEGRHAAKLSRLVGRNFSPDGSFASPLDMGEVSNAIESYLV